MINTPSENTTPTADTTSADTQATPTPEVQPPSAIPAVPEPKESTRHTAFLRREKQLQRDRAELQAAQQEIAARAQQSAVVEQLAQPFGGVEGLKEFLATLGKDPIAALEKRNLSYEALTDAYLRREDPHYAKERELETRLNDLQRQQQEREAAELKRQQDAELARQEEVARQYFDGATKFIQGKPDEYEAIQTYGAHDLVHELIQAQFDQTGEVLTFKTAADTVENHLLEQIKRASSLKKLQAKAAPEPQSGGARTNNEPPRTAPNLSNLSNGGPPPAQKPKDSRERALALLEQLSAQNE